MASVTALRTARVGSSVAAATCVRSLWGTIMCTAGCYAACCSRGVSLVCGTSQSCVVAVRIAAHIFAARVGPGRALT